MSRRMSARSASRGTGPRRTRRFAARRSRCWGLVLAVGVCEPGGLYGRNAGKCGGGAASWEESGARARRTTSIGRRRRPFRPTPLPRRVPGHAARARAPRALTIRHPRDVVETRCAKNGSGGGFRDFVRRGRLARVWRLGASARPRRERASSPRPHERARRSRTVRRTPNVSRDTNARVLSLESRSG